MSRFNYKPSLKKIIWSSSLLLALSSGIIATSAVNKAKATEGSSQPQGISSLTTENVRGRPTTNTFCNNNDANCYDKDFGTGDNIRLTGFSVGDKSYSLLQLVDDVKFRRVDNKRVKGERHIYFLKSGSNGSIASDEIFTMEEAVRSEFISTGTDNVFANKGGVNYNNIERVDFLIDGGLLVQQQYKDHAGFLLLERGGNDPFKIAAITAVDSNGNPTAFGKLLDIPKSTWGNSGIQVNTKVIQNEESWSGYRETATVNGQKIHGIFVSIASLGINSDETIYGYALFPSDINSSKDLVGLSNFPKNTSSASGKGGLDLISSGGLFIPDGLTSSDVFIDPVLVCSAPDTIELTGIVRDFSDDHPDFQYRIGKDRGMVTDTIGGDGKPVYAHPNGSTKTTNGKKYFDQWYRDVDGVNQSKPYSITLQKQSNGNYRYENSSFFPINGQLLGNEGRSKNFHFTYELHGKFVYKGGEVLKFSGDDDVWVYINGKRVVDLGGVHAKEKAPDVNIDQKAEELGLEIGGVYDFDFFFAERHTTQSNFVLETSIEFFCDNDRDSISNITEGSEDLDGDGIPNYLDTDSDGDDIPDSIEGTKDTDSDGTPDYQDTDSDGDTIPDSVEGNGNEDNDEIPNYLDTDSDGDGIPDNIEANKDTDNDGIPDYLDIIDNTDDDSDEDGILDSVEKGADPNNPVDSDNDGEPDYLDTDSDNDGIPDDVEAGRDSDNDGEPDYLDTDSDNDGIPDDVEGNGDLDEDKIPNYRDPDSDGDDIPDEVEGNSDLDNDGTPNYLDEDSDGDGIPDKVEGNDDPDEDLIPNYLDEDSDGDGIPDDVEGSSNADNDRNPNYLDLDSDGDGIPDDVEATGDPSNPASEAYNPVELPLNTDAEDDIEGNDDNLPDYLDSDSDGDGIFDKNEGQDLNDDGFLDTEEELNLNIRNNGNGNILDDKPDYRQFNSAD